MYAVRPGSPGPFRNLDKMLADKVEQVREHVSSEIEKRKKNGAPLVDEGTGDPIEVPEPYEPNPDFADIWVRLRAVPAEVYVSFQLRWSQLRTTEDSAEAFEKQSADSVRATREFIGACVVELEGLEDEEGPYTVKADPELGRLTEEQTQALHGAGDTFFYSLLQVCRVYQQLGPRERKNYGGPRVSTSRASSAALAPSGNGKALGVLEAPTKNGLQEPSTQPEPALAEPS